ncbi:gamma-glutamylcyclotransferase family protein [Verrucomicrobiales bacterium BCK34]|nr:gamma-glutamylcyclotransferase family protein [Verrucomicrobiales bacterium BCK34]
MNLFVYGTLLVPKIWEAVSGIPDAEGKAGSIAGYRIYRVRGGDFPGIKYTGGKENRVTGRVFHDLPERAIERLDAYEDSFYERREVEVRLADEKSTEAHAYVVPETLASDILSTSPWSLTWFEEHALESYWTRLFES